MIREVQNYWNHLEAKRPKSVALKFQITLATAKKYINMSKSDIESMNSPKNYKKRESPMNKWLNVIFKMMDDEHTNETIYFYILHQPTFYENKERLGKYIYLIGKNNFPNQALFNRKQLLEEVYPPEIIKLKRNDILKYLLTCNPKIKKDEIIGKYIDVIKEKYSVATRIETIFKEFHGIIMGSNTEKLEDFLKNYEQSEITSFCNGIKKDIAPVKNAISYSVSSGFVEGNNNKFKLLKRIVYGRSGLVNLTKKCKLAFLPKNENFSLSTLI